jgi:hypothetical protein
MTNPKKKKLSQRNLKNNIDEYLGIYDLEENYKLVPSKTGLIKCIGISLREFELLIKRENPPGILNGSLFVIESILEDMLVNSKIKQLPFKEYEIIIRDVKIALIEGFEWKH